MLLVHRGVCGVLTVNLYYTLLIRCVCQALHRRSGRVRGPERKGGRQGSVRRDKGQGPARFEGQLRSQVCMLRMHELMHLGAFLKGGEG